LTWYNKKKKLSTFKAFA